MFYIKALLIVLLYYAALSYVKSVINKGSYHEINKNAPKNYLIQVISSAILYCVISVVLFVFVGLNLSSTVPAILLLWIVYGSHFMLHSAFYCYAFEKGQKMLYDSSDTIIENFIILWYAAFSIATIAAGGMTLHTIISIHTISPIIVMLTAGVGFGFTFCLNRVVNTKIESCFTDLKVNSHTTTDILYTIYAVVFVTVILILLLIKLFLS